MYKRFVTRNQIRANYSRILYCGYCAMSHLLLREKPIAYNSGLYGWNYDAYEIDGTIILTGYKNMFGMYINPIEEEKQAQAIWENRTLTDTQKEEMVKELLWRVVNGGKK